MLNNIKQKLLGKVKSMLSNTGIKVTSGGVNLPFIPFNVSKAEHATVPAPQYLEDDKWFGPAIFSDENKDYMEREYEAFKKEAHKYYGTGESKTIHQDMYEIATQSGGTTIHLNPIGGSENYHER
tara:strand:+ start:1122 stop:1496 length:375 start_codon:yes stop_codon:yes gene_type:complete